MSYFLGLRSYCCGICFVLILFSFCPVFAGGLPDFYLIAPQTTEQAPVDSGGPVTLTILFTNPGDRALDIPGQMDLTIGSENGDIKVLARPLHPGQVPARGFLKTAYQFDLPADHTGLIELSEAGGQGNRVRFHAGAAMADAGEEETPGPEPINDLMHRFQPFFVNFSPYKPVYFLFGADPGIQKTSFQISFKYRLFNTGVDETDSGAGGMGIENLYLAYTQQSFWDLKSDSAPFEDSRYMPEVFYYDDDLGLRLPYLKGSGFQAGLQHESNGRGGTSSRSTNYAYVQPSLVFSFTRRIKMKLAPKMWVYVRNDNETNPDLADYRGYFDIETKIGDPEGLALSNHYRHGKKGSSLQFDLSYPLNEIRYFTWLPAMYIHAQYYTGYSENLLHYDRREDIVRLGFSLVR